MNNSDHRLSRPKWNHAEGDPTTPIGVLLVNLGSPDSPNTADVRRFLAQFLSDPAVVSMPRLPWKLLLHGVILRTRPKRSAAAYRKIWTDQGSPLLLHTKAQAQALQQLLPARYRVVIGMRYGNPSIASALEQLRQAGANLITVLPLYPHYSDTTTGSTIKAVEKELQAQNWKVQLNWIRHYPDHAGYIAALGESIQAFQKSHGTPQRLLFSFHGIPQSYADAGDPYPDECQLTANRLAARLGLAPGDWAFSYQSRMGRKPWLQPYTEELLRRWGEEGIKSVQVLCPGFSADCLETLEEVAIEYRTTFIQAGGSEYRYIPALNDRPLHIRALGDLITGPDPA